MRLTSSHYATALLALSEEVKDPTKAVSAFLSFVRKNRAMKKLPEILRIVEKLSDEREGRRVLTVETAREADEALRGDIERIAAREFPGAKLSFTYRVRPELLGGARISSDEAVIDATVRRRLKELERKIR